MYLFQDGCKAICGDAVVLGKEECDPPMEGCDKQCKLVPGWKVKKGRLGFGLPIIIISSPRNFYSKRQVIAKWRPIAPYMVTTLDNASLLQYAYPTP